MLKYIDVYFLDISFNVGFSWLDKAGENEENELHLFLGIFALVFGF